MEKETSVQLILLLVIIIDPLTKGIPRESFIIYVV